MYSYMYSTGASQFQVGFYSPHWRPMRRTPGRTTRTTRAPGSSASPGESTGGCGQCRFFNHIYNIIGNDLGIEYDY